MNLTSKLGDEKVWRIPLRWDNAAFVPGSNYGLTFTVKKTGDLPDSQALIQKATGGLGVTIDGDDALVTILKADTHRAADFPNHGDPAFDAEPGIYYWDIQADGLPDTPAAGDSRTVNIGEYLFLRDYTRNVGPTATIYTTADPLIVMKGDKGDTGATGPKGDKGDTGDKGDQGDVGLTGQTGAEPIISVTAPPSPAVGQFWYDPEDAVMSFWTGNEWVTEDVALLSGEVNAFTQALIFG